MSPPNGDIMPIVNGYTDLNTLKTRLELTGTSADTVLESIITTVSRWIDDYCDRRFYVVEEARYYTASFAEVIWIDDLVSVTEVATDPNGDRSYSSVWNLTDYDLWPDNAAADNKPYTRIYRSLNSTKYYPITMRRGVRVTGEFGYAATVPDQVTEACLLQCAVLWKRRDAIFGSAGPSQMGQVTLNFGGGSNAPKVDRDVKLLLAPFVRRRNMVAGV